MKIVILDGFTLNPGDLSWEGLQQFGDVVVHDRTQQATIVERANGADILLTNKTPITAATMAALPQLKYIGVLATGTNVVDLDAAQQQQITVTNVPAYGPDAVAQMVFAHILHYTQKVSQHHQAVVNNRWVRNPDFCFTLAPLHSLKGKVMGLIGYGDIGQQVADIARAFGMIVRIHTRRRPEHLAEGIVWCDLETLLITADILSLHCPLSHATANMINEKTLQTMKTTAVLINTARGGLIDEAALAVALQAGEIAYAGVDVLSSEPPQPDNPLLTAPNIGITPHNAWATHEARQNLLNIAVENIRCYLRGTVVNRVN